MVQRPQGRWNRVLIFTGPEEVHSMPWGALQGGQSKVQADSEPQDLGNIPLLGFADRMLCGSGLSLDFINSEQEQEMFW